MRYYGEIDPRTLFAKDDPARLIFEMAFGNQTFKNGESFTVTYGTGYTKNEPIIWGMDSGSFSKKAEWEEYKAKIPYTEFKERL